MFELPIKKKELSLHIRCDNHYLYTDPVLLEIILSNLLTNAIKFTEEGKILFAYQSINKQTIIYVMETGQGIDKKIDNMLKPYTTDDRISNEIGLGLDLAIVLHTIELLDLDSDMTSKLDHGTCFRIRMK